MKKHFSNGVLLTIATVFLSVAAFPAQPYYLADLKSKAMLTAEDRQFMSEAATGGISEVELGKLAVQKASSADVKAFGDRMVRDHSKANMRLKQLASQKGVTLPTTVTKEQKMAQERLGKLSGAQFDREYMTVMVEDHDKDVAAFQKKAENASDADLRTFVTETLPTLKEHQRLAHDIKEKM